MTSRERILTSLNLRQPDRVPVDFSGHRSSGILALAYARLRRYLGLTAQPLRVYDLVQQLAMVDEDLLDLFGVDTVEMGRGFLKEDKDWKEWVLPDGTPCLVPIYLSLEKRGEDWLLLSQDGRELGRQKKGWLYFEQTFFPYLGRDVRDEEFEDLEQALDRLPWTSAAAPGSHLPLDEQGLAEMARQAKTLRESTERAIIGLFGGNMFEIPQWLFRMDNYFLFLKLYPEAMLRLSEKLCAIHLKNLEKWLKAVGRYIDVILFGDDLGSQRGLLVSPEMYRRFIKPFHKRLWTRAKELAGLRVLLHCCGSVRDLLDDLIEAGLDAINPVQISAAGMDAAGLKAGFGARLAFWGGGCDTGRVLVQATPQEVAEHVKAQVRALSPGGGFIFQQVHNIQADVPPQNIVAMFEAVRETSL